MNLKTQQEAARKWFMANYLDGDNEEDAKASMINAEEVLHAVDEIVARTREQTLEEITTELVFMPIELPGNSAHTVNQVLLLIDARLKTLRGTV